MRVGARTLFVSMLALILAVGSAPRASAATKQPPSPKVGPEAPATASMLRAHNTPSLAADPTDPRFVVVAHRVDGPRFDCGLEVSGDGGRGWIPTDPVPDLPSGAEKCYAPEVAFDATGRLYYLFAGLQGIANRPMGVFLTTSDDRGRTFTAPRRVLGPNSFQVRMAIDQERGPRGRLHIVWLAATSEPGIGAMPPPPNPILAIHSDDGGATFSKPVDVSDPERARVVAPALALGEDGAVHVLYYDLRDDAVDYQGLEGPTWDGHWSLVLATSASDGAAFERGVVIDDEVVPAHRIMVIFTMPPPALAADRRGRLFAAWKDGRRGDADVFFRRSDDGGRSWKRAERLSDDSEETRRDQDLPRLAVAPGGRLDAIFYDRRHDPENVRNHVFYTFSLDGGRTFAPNTQLTTVPSDSRIGQRFELVTSARGQVEFGSRLGLVSLDDGAVAAWTDTRDSVQPLQQNIMTAVVALPAAARPQDRPPMIGVAIIGLATGALAGGALAIRRRRNSSAQKKPSVLV